MKTREEKKTGREDRAAMLKRREFLQVLGASFAAVSGCKMRPPKEKIVPHIEQPEGAVPGLSRYYASTCAGCTAACGTLVKSRDGRPIKMEGNPEHPLSRGGLCSRGQGMVLDLYDSQRPRGPSFKGAPREWADADYLIVKELEDISKRGGRIRLMTPTIVSPTLRAAIAGFRGRYPGMRHVEYDPLSCSAILDAHQRTHGRRALPRYHFDKARAIVSFDADFLGTWISPVEFAKDWAKNRRPEGEWEIMSWHAQFEPRMSLTGANADLRVALPPSKEFDAVLSLARRIAERTGWKGPRPPRPAASQAATEHLAETAGMLLQERGHCLVVSGSRSVEVQVLVNWINEMLGAYGSIADLEHPSMQKRGDDGALNRLVDEMKAGEVDAVIVCGANPAHDHPRASEFAEALKKVRLSVSLSYRKDETAALCQVGCPDLHPLESWGDGQPGTGLLSLSQPLIAPLFNGRPAVESLLAWAGRPSSAYDFLRARWKRDVFPRQKEIKSFTAFWDDSVRRGVVELPEQGLRPARFNGSAVARIRPGKQAVPAGRNFEFVAYPNIALAEGAQANNPWLQELPDPITKTAWGNCASFAPEDAARLGIVEGRVVRISASGREIELPAHLQPGQAEGVVAAALGYGRKGAGPIAANYPTEKMLPVEKELLGGADVYPLLGAPLAAVALTDKMSPLAKSQTHDSLVDPITGHRRPHVQETTLQDYFKDPTSGQPRLPEPGHGMWPGHEYKGHKWAMAVDLSACTGCSACVIACQSENNVPVVGKAEVRKSRDMHWLRIDRYYSATKAGPDKSPDTAFQPMLCQHCDNAPCETVCPVLATLHSSEGLNMQVYNRCVGTRYCANNCPYKVRRFNWFDYAHDDLLQNMALNPDITVRTRGVMEKCTFCVQRITQAKAEAAARGRKPVDGEVKTACMQSCPTNAIVFGDINDGRSAVAEEVRRPRSYQVLHELGVGPSVFYQTKVRNKKV